MCSQFWTLVCGCQEAPVHKPSLYSCTEVRGGRVSLLDHPSVQYHNVPLVENLISLSRLRVQSKLVPRKNTSGFLNSCAGNHHGRMRTRCEGSGNPSSLSPRASESPALSTMLQPQARRAALAGLREARSLGHLLLAACPAPSGAHAPSHSAAQGLGLAPISRRLEFPHIRRAVP